MIQIPTQVFCYEVDPEYEAVRQRMYEVTMIEEPNRLEEEENQRAQAMQVDWGAAESQAPKPEQSLSEQYKEKTEARDKLVKDSTNEDGSLKSSWQTKDAKDFGPRKI